MANLRPVKHTGKTSDFLKKCISMHGWKGEALFNRCIPEIITPEKRVSKRARLGEQNPAETHFTCIFMKEGRPITEDSQNPHTGKPNSR